MVRYQDFNDFYARNQAAFKSVLMARTYMKSPQELSLSGQATLEAHRLSYVYLNFANLITELRFGVVASVMDAKQDYRNASAQFMRSSDQKSVTTKRELVFADTVYQREHKKYNDLFDLNEYLEKRYSDFMATHYYYKKLSGD